MAEWILFALIALIALIGLLRAPRARGARDSHGRGLSPGDRVLSTVVPHAGTVVAIELDTPGAPTIQVQWDDGADLPPSCAGSTLLRAGRYT